MITIKIHTNNTLFKDVDGESLDYTYLASVIRKIADKVDDGQLDFPSVGFHKYFTYDINGHKVGNLTAIEE